MIQENDPTYHDIRRVILHGENAFTVPNIKLVAVEDYKYGSEWMTEKGTKPEVRVDRLYKDRLEGYMATIKANFVHGTVTGPMAASFLFTVFCQTEHELKTDWVSFNQKIGKAGDKITVSDLAVVKEFEADIPVLAKDPKDNFTDEDIRGYALLVAAVYRFHTSSMMEEYRKILLRKLEELTGKGYQELRFSSSYISYANWMSCDSYPKVCALVDMFLAEFPRHRYSQVRFGTIVTRYKDCSALLTLSSVLTSLGLSLGRFATWLWVSQAFDEFQRLVKTGEEMHNKRSYNLYMVELGMTPKSPYSATLNPNIHLLLHMVGCALASPRSINARMVGTPSVTDCLINAICLAYAHGTAASLTLGYTEGGEIPENPNTERAIPDATTEPEVKDPQVWAGWMYARNFVPTERMFYMVFAAWSSLRDVREGSVGAHCRTIARAYLKGEQKLAEKEALRSERKMIREESETDDSDIEIDD